MSICKKLLPVAARLIAAVAVGLCALPLSASAEGTYNFIFTGGATGTVTYANCDDSDPTEIEVFFDGIMCQWNTEDYVGPYNTTWDGQCNPVTISDGISLQNVNGIFHFDDNADGPNTWGSELVGTPPICDSEGFGEYTIQKHHPGPALGPLGLMALVALLGFAGYRKIRA